MPRRSGDRDAFWDGTTTYNAGSNPRGGVSVGANGKSASVELPRAAEHLMLFVTTGGATTINVEVAHSGDMTSEGVLPDGTPVTWHPLFYLSGAAADKVEVVFAGAGSAALLIPDNPVGFVRLSNLTAGVTLTAGWEASG